MATFRRENPEDEMGAEEGSALFDALSNSEDWSEVKGKGKAKAKPKPDTEQEPDTSSES